MKLKKTRMNLKNNKKRYCKHKNNKMKPMKRY